MMTETEKLIAAITLASAICVGAQQVVEAQLGVLNDEALESEYIDVTYRACRAVYELQPDHDKAEALLEAMGFAPLNRN